MVQNSLCVIQKKHTNKYKYNVWLKGPIRFRMLWDCIDKSYWAVICNYDVYGNCYSDACDSILTIVKQSLTDSNYKPVKLRRLSPPSLGWGRGQCYENIRSVKRTCFSYPCIYKKDLKLFFKQERENLQEIFTEECWLPLMPRMLANVNAANNFLHNVGVCNNIVLLYWQDCNYWVLCFSWHKYLNTHFN